MSQDNTSAVFGGLENTLLDGVTATGAGSVYDLRNVYYKHNIQVTWGGTAPDAVYITINGGFRIDNYMTIAEQIKITESPSVFEILSGSRYLIADYDSKDGGDETTSVTVKSVSGGS